MYLDTSAIVKLYVREPNSESIANAVAGQPVCSSRLAAPELFSALLRKERERAITESLRRAAWSRWHQHASLGQIQLIPISDHVLHQAWAFMQQCHPLALKTLDAIHLASFAEIDAGPLLTTDEQMRAAARHLGFAVVSL